METNLSYKLESYSLKEIINVIDKLESKPHIYNNDIVKKCKYKLIEIKTNERNNKIKVLINGKV